MDRRDFLALLGSLTSVAVPGPLWASSSPAAVGIVPIGSRARTLAWTHGLPVFGDAVTAAHSVVLVGCLGGQTGLREVDFWREAADRAIVLMPMSFEGRRRRQIAEAAVRALRAANVRVDMIEVPLAANLTLAEARSRRERALLQRSLEVLAAW